MALNLSSEKARVFRITHRDNVPWILDNGLHCKNSNKKDPNFVAIGNPELIDKRTHHLVPIGPKGKLSDYVPFYFTPHSVMLYNIFTGHNGLTRRSNDEIVIMVSSLHQLKEEGVPFVFTDRHAIISYANYYSDLKHLDQINWGLLRARRFNRDHENPQNFELYQAEALIHNHLPLTSLIGIVCNSESVKVVLDKLISARNLKLKTAQKSDWYF